MRTGRPVAKIELSSEVAGILEGYARRRKTGEPDKRFDSEIDMRAAALRDRDDVSSFRKISNRGLRDETLLTASWR